MNEKIKELAKQAGFQYIKDEGIGWAGNYNASLSKFAKLIVAECVIQCEREWIRHGTDSVHNQAIHGCINSIKKHFGVKE
jgi:hypothetical protein